MLPAQEGRVEAYVCSRSPGDPSSVRFNQQFAGAAKGHDVLHVGDALSSEALEHAQVRFCEVGCSVRSLVGYTLAYSEEVAGKGKSN